MGNDELDLLRGLAVRLVEACKDADLLDLLIKILLESGVLTGG